MPNYQNGKIYKIYCNLTGDTYYGSTVQSLAKRVAQHRETYHKWKKGDFAYIKSFDIIDRGEYVYSLVEEYPCENKEQLYARERYCIENNECINKHIPGRTGKEWYEDNKEKVLEKAKEYREQNKEHILEKEQEYREQYRERIRKNDKKYREQNKEKLAVKYKEYSEKNKEKIAERQKKYREQNRQKLAEKSKEYREQNKEHILDKAKEYREVNKEKIKEYREQNKEKIKEYREDNKEKIKEKAKEKVVCECGSEVRKDYIFKHRKTKKHLDWVESHLRNCEAEE
tara:strand:- start:152 stop:1006 length:855 start_codon:yes stop_codon:yes gene_type:complete